MFQHQDVFFRGAFDTKEYKSNTPTPREDGTLVLKYVWVFDIAYECVLFSV
jgi:hypothetical protein